MTLAEAKQIPVGATLYDKATNTHFVVRDFASTEIVSDRGIVSEGLLLIGTDDGSHLHRNVIKVGI